MRSATAVILGALWAGTHIKSISSSSDAAEGRKAVRLVYVLKCEAIIIFHILTNAPGGLSMCGCVSNSKHVSYNPF